MTKFMISVVGFSLGFYATDIYNSGVIQDALVSFNTLIMSLLGN